MRDGIVILGVGMDNLLLSRALSTKRAVAELLVIDDIPKAPAPVEQLIKLSATMCDSTRYMFKEESKPNSAFKHGWISDR